MADLNGYTGIPDTLPEAQAAIVRLLDEAKVASDLADEQLLDLNTATALIVQLRAENGNLSQQLASEQENCLKLETEISNLRGSK